MAWSGWGRKAFIELLQQLSLQAGVRCGDVLVELADMLSALVPFFGARGAFLVTDAGCSKPVTMQI